MNKKFIVGLTIFLLFGAGNAFACNNNGTCDWLAGEDSDNCSVDCVEWCGACTVTTNCDEGLTCDDGKCRGCACAADEVCFCNPLHACAFDELVDNMITFIFYIVIAVAPLMLIVAGFYFVTAAGDPKRMTTAKSIIVWTLTGLAITLLARGLIAVIKSLF